MGLLAKLCGQSAPSVSASADDPPCPHVSLVPRWDNAADMGHEDKVSTYVCEDCKHSFTAMEGRSLRQTEAARLKEELQA